ncbi:MAG: phosphoribosylglycinamide formyltransferase [Planctomycetota bacterium]|nr:phosphoribosylglycinamide formyltransferase [Planctomycetota bacterium]
MTPAPHRPTPAPLRLGILISGGGTTMVNLAGEIAAGRMPATIATVICSNPAAGGVERARNLRLPCEVVSRKTYKAPAEFSDVVFDKLREARVDLVCLAGFLSLLNIPDDFARRVINIHPALLPSFGGRGMHGHHVHEAVIAAGCKVSGCTVHFADQTYDTGPIIVQRCCEVRDDDTPDSLAKRVFEQECLAYPEAIRMIASGHMQIEGRRVRTDGVPE